MVDRPKPLPSGRLEEPVFIRGFDPMQAVYSPPAKPSPWARHFELGREHPAVWNHGTQEYDGGWMLVSRIVKGGCKARLHRINSDREGINQYVARHWPCERWQLRLVTVAGTWCDRELYMRFLGTLSPEANELDRRQHKERYDAMMALSRERKAERMAAARRQAQQDEAAAQVRIRARRRPGS